MDPVLAVFFMVMMGGTMIAMLQNMAERVAAQESEAIEPPKPDWFDCEVSTERIFEQRLVDAGTMQDYEMTVCENTECPNCANTHEANRIQRRLELRRAMQERRELEKKLDEQRAKALLLTWADRP